MVYHFVVQYFGLDKEPQKLPRELPAPPTEIAGNDEFGQTLAGAHRSLSPRQKQIVRKVLPMLLRLGSRSKAPTDWRPFWRAIPCPETDPDFRFVLRLWFSIAATYAQQDEAGNWHFASPSYTNLSAIRGMCWLYVEVFG